MLGSPSACADGRGHGPPPTELCFAHGLGEQPLILFGIKEAIATQAVARHPCNRPAFATQSVAARLPTLLVIAARGAAARLVTMSWLSRSDKEMDEQVEVALYEQWPRPNSGGRLVEVFSAGFQTMESRAGVQGSRPVERTDLARGVNLTNLADEAMVKTAVNNILPGPSPHPPNW